MIVSFSLSNFRSFAGEETFSLVASNRISSGHSDHVLPIPDSNERVLRTAVLYGANGAGKSNLFKALKYVQAVALRPRKRNAGTQREPFKFGDMGAQPSSFSLQFIAEGKLYEFGFKVDDQRILQEWLLQLEGGKHRSVYERVTDENGNVKIEAAVPKASNPKLLALATVGGPQNQSFLATVNATLAVDDFGPDLAPVLEWFKGVLNLIGPDESFAPLAHILNEDPKFLTFAGEFLKASSTGVDHLEVMKTEISEDEFKRLLPPSVVKRVLADAKDDEERFAVVRLGEGNELVIERRGEDSFYQIRVQTAHEHKPGAVVKLELDDESDGTRRLLNLLPALHHLRAAGAVYFIDEIDRSMHPILVRKFLEFFLQACAGGQRQVIVTTHESSLLDQDLLRRDEIWFTEKDHNAATRLYSLTDFKVRNDLELRKHYLQGRFGAVPFIRTLDNLPTEADPCV
jgi:AAA15 family ATPase/GTPase